MKNKYHYILTFVLLLSSVNCLHAIKATPNPISKIQTDGTEITYYLKGDEFFHYKTTLDNFLIVEDIDGIFNYGTHDSKGKVISTGVKVNEINKRTAKELKYIKNNLKKVDFSLTTSQTQSSRIAKVKSETSPQKSYPLTGNPKSLVILVNFSDKNYITPEPKTAFTDLLNQQGYSANGGTGSARDYFRDASNGLFNPQFDVVGPYTLTKSLAFYGENVSEEDKNPRQLVIDACTLADADGVDFAQYDTDNDGFVDNIFIYYAGNNEAEGAAANTIWPHRWSLSNYNTKFDGKIIFDYACTSELRGSSGSTMCGIGTFCHEFGHVLGLVDYYHTTEDKNTLENWSIMDSGAYLNQGRTPPSYSSYDRFYLGWLAPTELKSAQNVTLEAVRTSNKAFLISQNGNHNLNGANPVTKEFFLIENRQKSGFDAYLPSSGMLIWHIDYDESAWNDNSPNNYTGSTQTSSSHMRVYLQPLGGQTTTPGTAFTSGSFNPTLWNGTNINKPITDIKITNGVLTFKFMGGGALPTIATKETLQTFSTEQSTPSAIQQFKVTGKDLVADISISFLTKMHFQIRKASETENDWRTTITLSPLSGKVDTTEILVRYNPTEPSFGETHTDKIQISTLNADNQQLTVNGVSTRKVYVVPPVATAATLITSRQYTANWEEVFDATGYYVTAYSISEGNSTHTEGFDAGLTVPSDWKITASGVTTSASFSGKAIPALQLRKKDEYIQTEIYPTYASELSFFIKSIGSKNGVVKVEGNGEMGWSTIDEIVVDSNYVEIKKYLLNPSDKFKQFKITYSQADNFSIAIDDITVSFPVNLEFQSKSKWTTATSDTLRNLVSGRMHYYKIKASDLTLNTDKSIKYQNITNYSNIIQVEVLPYTNSKTLRIEQVRNTDNVFVFLENTENYIYIYNTSGQLIKAINPDDLKVNISPFLKKHNLYLIKSGDKSNKFVF